MDYLNWSRDLDTGIEVIDTQHRQIVDYINELIDARESDDRRQVGEVLNRLVDYTVSHFEFEEGLMEQAGYPHLHAHRKVHALFVRRVYDFVERFSAGEEVADELLALLRRWLLSHIRVEDGDYAPLVRRAFPAAESGWVSRTLDRLFNRR